MGFEQCLHYDSRIGMSENLSEDELNISNSVQVELTTEPSFMKPNARSAILLRYDIASLAYCRPCFPISTFRSSKLFNYY